MTQKYVRELLAKHTYGSAKSKASCTSTDEKFFDCSADTIVANDDRMYECLIQLKKEFKPNRAASLANGLRSYYRFKNNNREFPRLESYVPTGAHASALYVRNLLEKFR